jgi:antitoxin MazE
MKASIISIGNSKGLRIPKSILEQCQFDKEVELEVEDNCLKIRPIRQRRQGWEEQFIQMSTNNDDILIDEVPATSWELSEWEW